MTTAEKVKYPCKQATVDELDGMLNDRKPALRDHLHVASFQEIDWSTVRHLRLILSHSSSAIRLLDIGVASGPSLNHDGSWLLVILPKNVPPENYLNHSAPSLQTLRVHHFPHLSNLPGLEKHGQLTELDLSGCKNLTELPGLEYHTKLSKLNIMGSENITRLPELGKLTQLTQLSLWGCSKLTELSELKNLTQLTRLNLVGCTNLTELPGLEKLTQLTSIDFWSCSSLTNLPSLDMLTHLAKLNLFGCSKLKELPSLRGLTSLRYLNLRAMRLRCLPDCLPEIAERFSLAPWIDDGINKAAITLCGTTVEDIPDMSIFDQPFEVIEEFFRKRSQGQTQMLNEIKVVFLGDGEAGKSRTIARLMNNGSDPVDYTNQATPGIVIKHKDYTVDGRTFRVNYWDFGGQEIMHSMHRIFLTGRTMYVVLLNARDDTQGDRSNYWLQNIQNFAPGAPVLLVLNKIDQNPRASVDERTLRGRYPNLTQIVRLSALEFDQEEFNRAFADILLKEIQRTGYLDTQWPDSWAQVKRELENMKEHYILGNQYKAICKKHDLNEVQAELLHWFNDLGVSFCFCDPQDYSLKKHVILRPDWITNGLYIILFNECEGSHNGRIPHQSIYELLEKASYDPAIRCTLPKAAYDRPGDVEYVLGVMRKFQLSLDAGDDSEFVPMLCQQESTVNIQNYEQDASILEFRMAFEYLPNNLLHRLMVERHRELDMDNNWRTGAKFQLLELGLSAVVVIDGNHLRFFIHHNNDAHRPNTYLSILKANVDRIVEKMGLKAPACQLIYKLDGKRDVFDYEDVKLNQELGDTTMTSKAHRRKILIEDILNQSAPDTLENEQKLLDAIRKSCFNIQAEPDYYLKSGENGRGMEDKRNRRIRDDLEMPGYNVKDQTQRGLSGTERGVGELDLLLCNDRKEPWTIIEALRVSSGAKNQWNEHLDKLVANYNYFGAPCVYLLTYVDADEADFMRIWNGYLSHIPKHNPGKFSYCENSITDLESPNYLKTAKCRYNCGVVTTTAYHIFVRIPKQGETPPK